MQTTAKTTFSRLTLILIGVGIFVYYFTVFLGEFTSELFSPLTFFSISLFFTEYFRIPLLLGGTVSVSGGILIAALFLLPLSHVLILTSLGVLTATLVKEAKEETPDVFLSLAQKIIVVTASAWLYYVLGGKPLLTHSSEINHWLSSGWPIILMTLVVYFLTDYTLDQYLVSLKYKTPFKPALFGAIRYQSLGWVYFGSLPPGILGAIIFKSEKPPFDMIWSGLLFLLFLGLLQYASFLNFRSSESYPKMLQAVMTAIEAQDPLLRGHAERVSQLAAVTAREMGLYGEKLNLVTYAALLHNIGKIYLDEDSPEYLIAGGTGETSLHPVHGAQILGMDPYLKQVANVVRQHHEPYSGIKRTKDHIPLGAKIINVVADFDEITQVLPFEERQKPKKAITTIKENQGQIYDPKVVRAFEKALRKQNVLF